MSLSPIILLSASIAVLTVGWIFVVRWQVRVLKYGKKLLIICSIVEIIPSSLLLLLYINDDLRVWLYGLIYINMVITSL